MEQSLQQLQRPWAVPFCHGQLEGSGQHSVIGKAHDSPLCLSRIRKVVSRLLVPLLNRQLNHVEEGGLDGMGPVKQVPLQDSPGLLDLSLLPPQGGGESTLVHMGIG